MTPNPKAAEGDKKCPMHLLPPVALEQIAWAHKAGADIYQPFNWRTQPIQMTTYVAALLRHTLAWAGGEDIDPKSGLSHLAHIGANVNLLLDAAHCGTLVDDRPKVPVKLGPFGGKIAPSIEEDPNWRKTDHGFVWNGPPVPMQFVPDPPYVLADLDSEGKLRCRMVLPGQEHPDDVNEIPKEREESVREEIERWKQNPDREWTGEDFAVPTGMNGIQPPQYRMLEEGEAIIPGDEVMTPEKENIRPRWIPAYGHFLSQQVFSFNVGCIRRPLP